jgi:flavin-dependent dehydrogenase
LLRRAEGTLKQNGIRNVDVAVLGGGPAGAAIALEFLNRGYSTAVIERSNYGGARIGETLPPAIQTVLADLGIWDRFLAEKHSPSFGIRSAWGGDELRENDFIFSPYGSGWHIDRARFDAMLARCAEEAGAAVYRDARLASCESQECETWKLEIAHADQSHSFIAKFLIDATGRASYAARKQGARRLSWDRLIGVVCFFSLTSQQSLIDSSTLIEAVEDGWWYSAGLPGSGLVLAFMTDADLYARALNKARNYWSQQLAITKHTRLRVENFRQTSGPHIVPANSSRLDRATNGSWLAIGDAAIAFDPLSGQGVFKALQSASRAAESIDRHWKGDASALIQYALSVEQDFDRYLLKRRVFYAREQRWPRASFWQSRASDRTVAAHQAVLALEN